MTLLSKKSIIRLLLLSLQNILPLVIKETLAAETNVEILFCNRLKGPV